MSTVEVICPGCGAEYSLGEEYWDKNAVCPACETAFYVPFPTADTDSPDTLPPRSFANEESVPAEWEIKDIILDLYEVKDIHEGGGMGLVYRVHHRGWNMDLAVKTPRPEFFQTERQKENFIRECETWVNLGLHPHVVSCFYVRNLGNIPRIFAEYVEGGTLKEWIETGKLYEGGPQETLKRILDIAIQMAWGMQFAHARGLIHQDVKPANILMTPDGTAKVTDFGLTNARATAGESPASGGQRSILASSGGMTPAYCSPEQAEIYAKRVAGIATDGLSKLTRRTDIWSWGVVVLEMCIGEVCWQSGTAASLVLQQYQELKRNGLPDMPAALHQLLDECFRADPEARPRGFLDVAECLLQAHLGATGENYGRQHPEAAELLADGLNNRAVSLLDLGKHTEAEGLFDQLLREHPGHLEATFNLGLLRWRNARQTDFELLNALKHIQQNRPRDSRVRHLLGLIHLQRRDITAAIEALQQAEQLGGGEETKSVLASVQASSTNDVRWTRLFKDDAQQRIESVALSADGRRAMWNDSSNTIYLANAPGGVQKLRQGGGFSQHSRSVGLSADGRYVIAALGNDVGIWDTRSGKPLHVFKGHTSSVTAVALSADGRWAISGSYDKTLRLWDVVAGRHCRTFEGHTDMVLSIAMSENGRWTLSASLDGTLRLWEVLSGKCAKILTRGPASLEDFNLVELTSDGHFALSCKCREKAFWLWDVTTGQTVRILEGHTGIVRSMAIGADGRLAVSGSDDGTIRIWNLANGKCLRTLEGHTGPVNSVTLSADGRRALSGSNDGTVLLWELGTQSWCEEMVVVPTAVCRLESANEVNRRKAKFFELMQTAELACAERKYSPCAKLVLEARSIPGYEVSRNALDLGRFLGRFGNRKACRGAWRVGKLEESRGETPPTVADVDARWMFGGHGPWSVKLWNGSTRTYWQIDNHAQNVTSADMTADGRWVLMGSSDGKIRLREAGAGRCVQTLEGHSSEVTALAISVTGRVALSASKEDGTVRMWDLITGRCLDVCEDFTNERSPIRLIISPDEQWALSVNESGEIEEWLLGVGGALWAGSFKKNIGKVTAIALSSDGRWVLSGDSTGAVQLWEIENASCVRSLEGHTHAIRSLTFSSDGLCALSTSRDGTLRIWEVATGHCQQTLADNFGEASLSGDAHWLLRGGDLWEIDWDYEFPEPAAWNNGAEPYLKIFLTVHCPLHENGYERIGKPVWTDDEIPKLMADLQTYGYGWLKSDGVHKQLKKMTDDWKEPPKIPGLKRYKQMMREMSEKYPDLGIQVSDSTADG